ncbi:MAG: hypothetical protein HY279_14940 [Nitrospinae bacterium]|nr:hypothetical protein [Nitrospinota bacterium]
MRGTFIHLYFGDEFCENKIPPLPSLRKHYALCNETGLRLMFATPPVTDHGLEKLKKLFKYLDGLKEEIEVVINDFGVLNLIKKGYPYLRPVLGRLMNKMIRDPRITPAYTTNNAPPDALLSLQQYGSLRYYRLLKKFAVKTVEVDNFHQGINIDFKGLGLKPSIHLPFGFVTTGRVCLFSSAMKDKKEKFLYAACCRRECDDYFGELKGNHARLIQKGNTIFYFQEEGMTEKGLNWAAENGALMICKPRLFSDVAYTTEDAVTARSILKGDYNARSKIIHEKD